MHPRGTGSPDSSLARAAILAIALIAACGSDSKTPQKGIDAPATPADAACTADGCKNPCAVGNDKGVGRYCTPGGGECNANSNLGGFIFCTKDYEPAEDVQYCTGPCTKDSDCGQNAYCTGAGQGGRGCIPASCGGMPSVDAGVDAP